MGAPLSVSARSKWVRGFAFGFGAFVRPANAFFLPSFFLRQRARDAGDEEESENRGRFGARCSEEERPTLWSRRLCERRVAARARSSRRGGWSVARLQEQKIAGDVSALPDRKERRKGQPRSGREPAAPAHFLGQSGRRRHRSGFPPNLFFF